MERPAMTRWLSLTLIVLATAPSYSDLLKHYKKPPPWSVPGAHHPVGAPGNNTHEPPKEEKK
jgi:hypothetical protein